MFLIQLNMNMFIKIFFCYIHILQNICIVFTVYCISKIKKKFFFNLINFYVYCIHLELFNITLRHYH